MLKERKLIEYIGQVQDERIKLLKDIENIAIQQNSWVQNDKYDLFENAIGARDRKIKRIDYIVEQFDDANKQLRASYNYNMLQNEIASINHNQMIISKILEKIVATDQETQALLTNRKSELQNAINEIKIKRKVSSAYKSAEVQKDGVFIDKYK